MTLNEEVARALGWDGQRGGWLMPGAVRRYPCPDFEHDWNAVYRWLFAAVKEMPKRQQWAFWDALTRLLVGHAASDVPWILHATPEDYCRAFLAVTERDERPE